MENSITEHFEDLKDPRIERQKRYPLSEILLVGLCSIISGGDGFADMQTFGEQRLEFFKELSEFEHGIPSDDTFRRVFSILDPVVFRDCFASWVEAFFQRSGRIISIDGKCLRRSKRKDQPALHMVSAWADKEGLVLAEKPVDKKSNEIIAIKDLLELLDINDKIITIDAIGCQKDIAERIVSKGGDYILALKSNQKTLYNEVKEVFDGKRKVPQDVTIFDEFEKIEKDHGRIETRKYKTINCLNLPISSSGWKGINSLIEVESTRDINGKISREKRYYISSLEEGAESVGDYIRSHWGIENRAHWILDVVLREDESRISEKNGAENVALLRRIAMNLVRQDPEKGSLRSKLKKAGWSEKYLKVYLTKLNLTVSS